MRKMSSEELDRLQAEIEALYQLLDIDPAQAISLTRLLKPDHQLNQIAIETIRSCILVDGGKELRDISLVQEGVDLLRMLRASVTS